MSKTNFFPYFLIGNKPQWVVEYMKNDCVYLVTRIYYNVEYIHSDCTDNLSRTCCTVTTEIENFRLHACSRPGAYVNFRSRNLIANGQH